MMKKINFDIIVIAVLIVLNFFLVYKIGRFKNQEELIHDLQEVNSSLSEQLLETQKECELSVPMEQYLGEIEYLESVIREYRVQLGEEIYEK